MKDCFISYKEGVDNDFSAHLTSLLNNEKFNVLMDKRDLLPGDKWAQELCNLVNSAQFVIALFTEDYIVRIEEGNLCDQNYIIHELEWALADSNKSLISFAIGVDPAEVIRRCSTHVKKLTDVQFGYLEDKSDNSSEKILNSLKDRLIREFSRGSTTHGQTKIYKILTAQKACEAFNYPWDKEDALKYKVSIEDKIKTPLELVTLAKFYLAGRFDIKIEPDKAFSYLMRASSKGCIEADFELGKLYDYGCNNYSFNEEQALKHYKKAHDAGYFPATAVMALIEHNSEQSAC
jgi:hypothetical protein